MSAMLPILLQEYENRMTPTSRYLFFDFSTAAAIYRRYPHLATNSRRKKARPLRETGPFLAVEKLDQPRVRERIMKLS